MASRSRRRGERIRKWVRAERGRALAGAGRRWGSASTTECCCSTWRSPGGSAKWLSWGRESWFTPQPFCYSI